MPARPSAEHPTVGDLSGRVLEALWEDDEFVLSRSVRNDEPYQVLVIAPVLTTPGAETLARLERAYAVAEGRRAGGRAGQRAGGGEVQGRDLVKGY
jgi:hypothetical protein